MAFTARSNNRIDDQDEWMRDMYVVNTTEQVCCTCSHWTGSRVTAEDGLVYSMKNLEGICSGIKRREEGAEFTRALTLPDNRCMAWKKWFEIEEGA